MPGKVTNFLWRVCKGCLPTTTALHGRRVTISEECPWCHQDKEYDVHVLFTYDFDKITWHGACFSQIIQLARDDVGQVFDVLRKVFQMYSREQCVQIGILCWSLWNRCNKWVWDKVNSLVFGVQAASMNLLHDWKGSSAAESAANV